MTGRHEAPWEHPDWYDLHDTTWTAGPEREPEHYRELVLSLPALDAEDHVLDAGCGTGKLAALVARGYPRLGVRHEAWRSTRSPSLRLRQGSSPRPSLAHGTETTRDARGDRSREAYPGSGGSRAATVTWARGAASGLTDWSVPRICTLV